MSACDFFQAFNCQVFSIRIDELFLFNFDMKLMITFLFYIRFEFLFTFQN